MLVRVIAIILLLLPIAWFGAMAAERFHVGDDDAAAGVLLIVVALVSLAYHIGRRLSETPAKVVYLIGAGVCAYFMFTTIDGGGGVSMLALIITLSLAIYLAFFHKRSKADE